MKCSGVSCLVTWCIVKGWYLPILSRYRSHPRTLTWGHLTRSPGWPPSMCSLSLLNARYHHHHLLQTRVALTRVKSHAASVWINPQESDSWGAEQRKLKEVKLRVFTKICLDTNTYYVKLRVCWSRKVIILSNVNIYGRQHISNSSWWAVNFDPRLEEILQASVPCLLERERVPSFLPPHSFYARRKMSSTRWWMMSWMTRM